MADNKRKVEVFTGGCPVCDSTVQMVKELTCPSCEVHIHDLNKSCETGECQEEAKKYGINKVPAVVVDGKICSCCVNEPINKDDLKAAGIGTSL